MNHERICRLCSSTKHVFDLFHPNLNNAEQVRESIFLATGVKIEKTDTVSKMVCRHCCEIVLKLFIYRTNAIANDKLLKETAIAKSYSPPIKIETELYPTISEMESNTRALRNSLESICIPSEDMERVISISNDTRDHAVRTEISKFNNKSVTEKQKHGSVCKLFEIYKNVIIPEEIFMSDVAPIVSLNSTEVSDWYSRQSLSADRRTKVNTVKSLDNNRRLSFNGKQKRKRNYMRILRFSDSDDTDNDESPTKNAKQDKNIPNSDSTSLTNIKVSSDKGHNQDEQTLAIQDQTNDTPRPVLDLEQKLSNCETSEIGKTRNAEWLTKHRSGLTIRRIIKSPPTISIISNRTLWAGGKIQHGDLAENGLPVAEEEYIDYTELNKNTETENEMLPKSGFGELGGIIGDRCLSLLEEFEKNEVNSDNKLLETKATCESNKNNNESSSSSINEGVTIQPLVSNQQATLNEPTNSRLSSLTAASNDTEIITSLIEKHFQKNETATQTDVSYTRTIQCIPNGDGVLLSNMFDQLDAYEIPVEYSSQPEVKVHFKPPHSIPEVPTEKYSWAHKMTINLQRHYTGNRALSTANNVALPNHLTTKPRFTQEDIKLPPAYSEAVNLCSSRKDESKQTSMHLQQRMNNFNRNSSTVSGNLYNAVPPTNLPMQRSTINQNQMPKTVIFPQSSSGIGSTSKYTGNYQDNALPFAYYQTFYNNQSVNVYPNYPMFPNGVQPPQQTALGTSTLIPRFSNTGSIPLPPYKESPITLQNIAVAPPRERTNVLGTSTQIPRLTNTGYIPLPPYKESPIILQNIAVTPPQEKTNVLGTSTQLPRLTNTGSIPLPPYIESPIIPPNIAVAPPREKTNPVNMLRVKDIHELS